MAEKKEIGAIKSCLRFIVLRIIKNPACRRALVLTVRSVDGALSFCGSHCDKVLKYVGPVLVTVALGLYAFVSYTFFIHVLPLVPTGDCGRAGLTLIAIFLVNSLLYNHWKAILTSPGEPPDYEAFAAENPGLLESCDEASRPTECQKCLRLKPQRTHHCSVCKRCVLKMDHHCPWINNCVGFRNYRYFALFLLYLWISCAFVVATFGPIFWDLVMHPRRRRRRTASGLSDDGADNVMMSMIICISILIAVSMLAGFHTFLVFSNQTTIEFQMNMRRREDAKKRGHRYQNPYNVGRMKNFRQVFGPYHLCDPRWAQSWMTNRSLGDGMQFPMLQNLSV